MLFLVVGLAALLASCLTLFSGFGLGTILTPVFALFFPAELAVGMTAVVHLAANLFKGALLGRKADLRVALRFGLPAAAAAYGGARLLAVLAESGRAKPAIGGLLIVFVALESWPRFSKLELAPRWQPLGGLLSGFFGGLSGNQGALRTAFLAKAGLSKEAFIATGVAIACLVDVSRLAVYARRFSSAGVAENAPLLAFACACAFAGAFLGARLLEKTTLLTVQRAVAAGLVLIGLALIAGII